MKLDKEVVEEITNKVLAIYINAGGSVHLDAIRKYLRSLDLVFKEGDSSQSVLVKGK